MTGYKEYISEVLTKENERYNLKWLGFFSDIEKETALYCSKFPMQEGERLTDWEYRTLREFYRLKGFSTFCRENLHNENFEKMVRHLMNVHLNGMLKKNGPLEIDRYLAPEKESVAFCLPEKIFQQIYGMKFSNFPLFGHPDELNEFCREVLCEYFPLAETTVLEEMEENDPTLWDRFYRKLRPITACFSYKVSHTFGEENTHDIWTATCEIVNKAVVEHRLQDPVTAKSVMAYAAGTIRIKNLELLKSRSRQTVNIEEIDHRLSEEENHLFFNEPVTLPDEFPSQDFRFSSYIDLTDPQTVRNYMVVILYNPGHPLHSELVGEDADRLERLFDHYLQGLSYEDLVRKYYGEKSGKELKRQSAQIRQEVRRLKERLTERYYSLIEQYK